MAPKKAGASAAGAGAGAGAEGKAAWVLLVCGLPGSGKTTLRQRLVKSGWAYVSQDEMATAEACEKALVKALKAGSSVVVDRCNVTPSDRRLWMQHANRAVDKGLVKGVKLHFEAVWMATPPEVCKERARGRAGHETLSPEKADEVVDSFCRGLRPPERSGQEPYDAVHVVASSEDADVLMRRFANPAKVDASVCLALGPAAALAAAAQAAAAAAAEAGATAAPQAGEGRDARAREAAGAELFIMRHGERADRKSNRDDGWPDDPPLTKTGRTTAKRAGTALRSLATLPWAPVVYSSPFHRCLQTADEVAAELGCQVRVEPGLSELCCERIFEQPPRLRPPEESLSTSLHRSELDTAQPAPERTALPEWPEGGRQANERVVQVAQALASRHPGCAVCLVCHGHTIVELTRRLPKSGGGAVGMDAGYCALSHIAPNGHLIRGLSVSYMKSEASASSSSSAAPPSIEKEERDFEAGESACSWAEGWRWLSHSGQGPESSDEERSSGAGKDVDRILALGLDAALAQYPAFARVYLRGAPEKQLSWKEGWAIGSQEVREKLQQALAHGLFNDSAASSSSSSSAMPSASPQAPERPAAAAVTASA